MTPPNNKHFSFSTPGRSQYPLFRGSMMAKPGKPYVEAQLTNQCLPPPNKGHIGITSPIVPCREVVLISEVNLHREGSIGIHPSIQRRATMDQLVLLSVLIDLENLHNLRNYRCDLNVSS